jgi:GDP-4-dehydro-6-deoxy-D-mannose reductase
MDIDLPNWNQARILVTGAQGFIGQHLTKKLSSFNPQRLILLGRSESNLKKNESSLEYVRLDLTNKTDIVSFAQQNEIDIIYNLAGRIDQSTGLGKYEDLFTANYLTALHLVEAFQDKIKLFVHIGTNAEYGNAPIPHHPVMTCEEPNSAYGVSKLAATKMLLAKAQSENLKIKVFRPFLVFGQGQNANSLLEQVVKACKVKEKMLTSANKQTRDFISVVRVVDKLIDRDVLLSDVKVENICSGSEIAIRDILESVKLRFSGFNYMYTETFVRRSEITRSVGFIENQIGVEDVKEEVVRWILCQI